MSLTPGLRLPMKRGPKPQYSEEVSQVPISTDDPPDFESHVILRVPEDCVGRIEKIIESDGKLEDFAINLNGDARNSTIRIGNQLLNGKILDLPTVTEVHKTLDSKCLYKVADVSQILVCTHDSIHSTTGGGGGSETSSASVPSTSAAPSESTEDAQTLAKRAAKQWQYPHGLTPPMKCARKKRFRKTKKKKFMDAPEVEKELKRLLRADLEADSVKWEIVEGNKGDIMGVVGDEGGGSRSQRHVTYPSTSEEDSDALVDDDDKDD